MNKRFGGTAAFAVMCVLVFGQVSWAEELDGKSWWEHVQVLAADDMEGREAGSPGLRKAAGYIVEELKKSGVQPAGVDGFYQPVKFRSRQVDESQSSISLVRNGKTEPLVLGEDVMFATRYDLGPEIEAPLAFVGYGLRVPEVKHDDFAGLDLKGKVAVMMSGSTAEMPTTLAAHYRSMAELRKALIDAGAVGILTLPNPAAMDTPWSRISAGRLRPSFKLADSKLDDAAGIKFAATLNPAKAELLFEGTGHTFKELAALAKDRKPLPKFMLPLSVKSKVALVESAVECANVVGKVVGTDPKLKDEYVVLSAHMDHVGVGAPVNGDRIYNGAMDNGSGSAAMLDLARWLTSSKTKLKRSVLFVFVTAEEKGLLGSRYFVANPTVPRTKVVANLNMDMFLPLFPMKMVTVYGLEESELGDLARKAAAKQRLKVQNDPEPLRNAFIRSDQYSFIRQGIPAVALKVGYEKGSAEARAAQAWLKQRYHAPSDDLQQPLDLGAAGAFESFVGQFTVLAANAKERPKWKSTSFFRRFEKPDTGK